MATFQRRRVVGGFHTRAIVRRGGRSWSKTCKTKKAAQLWARDLEGDLAAGRAPSGAEYSLAHLVDRYAATVLPGLKTGAQTESCLRSWIGILGDRPIGEITARDVAEARDALMVLHSPGTVRRYLSALSAAFNRAIKDWQWAGENPCKSIYWPKAPRGRVRFLDDDELPRLRAACRALSVDLADMVDLALLTGMRQGEILGLSWGDVDWGHARLILHETKNGERRQVPLTSQALAILQRRCPAGWTRSMVIFCRRGSPDRPTDLRRTWSRALLDARVADFRFHDLRHTAASYLAMTGATPNQIAEILGHKTLAMVKRYAHLSVENQATVLARLSDRLLPDPD